jgi:hypothetical protein
MTKVADEKRGRGGRLRHDKVLSALARAVRVGSLAACSAIGGSSSTPSTAAASTTSGPAAASLSLGGKLTGLRAGAKVARQQPISGVVTGLPSGDTAWLVVYPDQAHAYWPQKGPLKVDTAGSFRATAVFGSAAAGNVGQGFVVRLVITSAAATARFRAFLADPSQGLPKLPAGVRTLTRVAVVRG